MSGDVSGDVSDDVSGDVSEVLTQATIPRAFLINYHHFFLILN